jgi:hypothetical protein
MAGGIVIHILIADKRVIAGQIDTNGSSEI